MQTMVDLDPVATENEYEEQLAHADRLIADLISERDGLVAQMERRGLHPE